MLNQQKVAHLTALINQSKILTDKEKSDWLGLVELMNDKQLGELEDILVNTKPQSQVAQSPNPETLKQPNPAKPDLSSEVSPDLSHISNLPVGLTQMTKPPESASGDYNTPANLRSAFVKSGQRLNPTPVAPIKPVLPKPAEQGAPSFPPAKPTEQAPITRAPIGRTAPQSSAVEPVNSSVKNASISSQEIITGGVEQSSSQPPISELISKPEQQKQLQKTAAEINDLNGIKELTFHQFRNYYYDSTLKAVQDLVLRLGYFAVIVALENSPAYKTYIDTGKILLGDSSQDASQMFSKLEFEEFTDLLLDMRVNVN